MTLTPMVKSLSHHTGVVIFVRKRFSAARSWSQHGDALLRYVTLAQECYPKDRDNKSHPDTRTSSNTEGAAELCTCPELRLFDSKHVLTVEQHEHDIFQARFLEMWALPKGGISASVERTCQDIVGPFKISLPPAPRSGAAPRKLLERSWQQRHSFKRTHVGCRFD